MIATTGKVDGTPDYYKSESDGGEVRDLTKKLKRLEIDAEYLRLQTVVAKAAREFCSEQEVTN